MSGGSSSEGSQISIRQPEKLRPEQEKVLAVQSELVQFQLRTLEQQRETQRLFFSQAFPEESSTLFRREAEELRRRASVAKNKADSFRRGESLVDQDPLTAAGLSQAEALNRQSQGGGLQGRTQEGFQARDHIDQITKTRLKKGLGRANTLDNEANVLNTQAALLDKRAEDILNAPPHPRADFVKPLVKQEAVEDVGKRLEAALASRKQLGPIRNLLSA